MRGLKLVLAAVAATTFPISAVAGGHGQDPRYYLVDSIPDTWAYTSEFSQELPTDDQWWKSFEDPILDSLISRGVDNNFDLKIAMKRIDIAKNALNSVRGDYLPTVGVSGSWTKSQTSGMMGSKAGQAVGESYFSLGLNMNWEIDVFGKITSNVKSEKALYKASRAEYAAAMVSLCSQIATDYLQLRVWQAELELAQRHTESQQKIVDLTIARKDAGIASMLDVTQAKIVLSTTRASIPLLENSITTGINALAILIGTYPEDITAMLSRSTPLPDYRQIIATGIPMELLRRRPDIVESEMQLASCAALVGVSKKDFLPVLSLSGTVGTAAHNAGDLFGKQSLTYSVVPTLSWTIFDGMKRKYNLADARDQMEIAIADYNLTVMTAVEETDNAMSSYLSALRHIDRLTEVVEHSGKAFSLSVDLYKQGLTAFSNVVDSQLSLLESENSLIVARGDALAALINIYKALGGGWDVTKL